MRQQEQQIDNDDADVTRSDADVTRSEDGALDDDRFAERSSTDRTGDLDGATGSAGDRGDLDGVTESTGDRGDLADAGRAGSDGPTGEAAGNTGTVYATAEADGADEARSDARQRSDTPEFHEPAPLPTAFGASTVGGAVAASALAGSHRDPRSEDTVRSGDGPADDRIDGVGDATRAGVPADGDEPVRPVDPSGRTLPEGSAVGVAHPVNGDAASTGDTDALAGETRSPTPAGDRNEPATTDDEFTTDDATASDDATTTTDGGGTADGGLPPGAEPAEPIVALLDQEAVQGFRDRWRDVQLRFVDDPPGATEQAHRLVRESVEAVTAALTRQSDELGGWQNEDGTDTERLRMVVRRHRDFLDRLLGR